MTAVATRFGIWTNRAQPGYGDGPRHAVFPVSNIDGRMPPPMWGRVIDRSRSWQEFLGNQGDFVTEPENGASLAATLENVTLSSGATVAVSTTLAATLGNVTLSSGVSVSVVTSLAATLENLTLSSNAVTSVFASLASTLADMTLSSGALVAVSASLSQTLGDVTLSSDVTSGGGPPPPPPEPPNNRSGGGGGYWNWQTRAEQQEERLERMLERLEEVIEPSPEKKRAERKKAFVAGVGSLLFAIILKKVGKDT